MWNANLYLWCPACMARLMPQDICCNDRCSDCGSQAELRDSEEQYDDEQYSDSELGAFHDERERVQLVKDIWEN